MFQCRAPHASPATLCPAKRGPGGSGGRHVAGDPPDFFGAGLRLAVERVAVLAGIFAAPVAGSLVNAGSSTRGNPAAASVSLKASRKHWA